MSVVYAKPEYIDALATSTPISAHVRVDFELQGCPINKTQLLEVVSSFLLNKRPNIPSYSVCVECKQKGNVCVMVAHGTPCLGPVTHAGCYALCPTYDRGCYGCYGPKENANTASLSGWFMAKQEVSSDEVVRKFRKFYAWSEPFRSESLKHEKK
jgi:coenzyme F420-reducing hydrogenase gamma subunit